MNINYYAENVYGNELLYLAEPKIKACWTLISGKKTITKSEFSYLNELVGGNLTFTQIIKQ
jgi:hypothetical protein